MIPVTLPVGCQQYPCRILHLFDQPILLANHLGHVHLLLTPVEIFLFIGEVSLEKIISCRIAADVGYATIEHVHSLFLNVNVSLDIIQWSLYDFAALAHQAS